MFTLFSSKISLCDLLRTGFTDYHSHLLPGIDDGAAHLDQSKQLLSSLSKLGVHTLYCTPHIIHSVYNNTPEIIREAHQLLLQEAQNNGIQLHVAAEYMLDDGFAKHLENDLLLTFPNREVLVEMSYIRPPMSLSKHLFDLRTSGYTPVLAHPERYEFYHNDPEAYETLREAGCKFQLNLLSLGGYYGKSCNKVARYLLQNGFYTHVGTDTHKLRHIEALQSIKIKKQDASYLSQIIGI